MATVNFSVTTYGRGYGGTVISSSVVRTSGQDVITTAENLEDAGGDITLGVGEVIALHCSGPMRVRFGGVAATATTGHYIPADTKEWFEVAPGEAGTVSMIDAT